MTAAVDLYLASASPRRAELLTRLGVVYHVIPSHIDETEMDGEAPLHYVERLARAKALATQQLCQQQGLPSKPVLAADTTVALGSTIFGKPDTPAHARAMLQQLSGQQHQVFTAVAIADQDKIVSVVSQSDVSFFTIPDTWLAHYLASGEPFDKAGAYGIQGIAETFVRKIDGSFSGIMGLPLHETALLLQRFAIPFVLQPKES